MSYIKYGKAWEVLLCYIVKMEWLQKVCNFTSNVNLVTCFIIIFEAYFSAITWRFYLFVLYVYVTLLIVLLLNFQALCTKLLCCNFSWFGNKSQTCISHSITVYFSGWKVQGTIYLGQQGQFPKTKLEWSISQFTLHFSDKLSTFSLRPKYCVLSWTTLSWLWSGLRALGSVFLSSLC